jgi:hypothetical protein
MTRSENALQEFCFAPTSSMPRQGADKASFISGSADKALTQDATVELGQLFGAKSNNEQ